MCAATVRRARPADPALGTAVHVDQPRDPQPEDHRGHERFDQRETPGASHCLDPIGALVWGLRKTAPHSFERLVVERFCTRGCSPGARVRTEAKTWITKTSALMSFGLRISRSGAPARSRWTRTRRPRRSGSRTLISLPPGGAALSGTRLIGARSSRRSNLARALSAKGGCWSPR